MKGLVVFTAVLVVTSSAWAGPKDKVQQTFIDASSVAGNGGSWNNTTVSAKLKSKGCKIQIQFKDTLPALEGEQIICIAEADVRADLLGPGIFGNSVVMAGTVSGGKLKIKADLSQAMCGTTNAVNFNGGARCYRQDSVFTGANSATNWEATCLNAPTTMAPVLPAEPGSDSLLGICQSLNPAGGERIDPPASALLVVQGSYNPIIP